MSGIRRIVVVVLEGLDLGQVDHFLEQGLLHYLALLGDVGARFELQLTAANDCDAVCTALCAKGIPAAAVPRASISLHLDLEAICACDRAQQEQLIAALRRCHDRVVLCKFDMLRQLRLLFGSHPDAEQQLVIRDVYARMDEIVGKALSCCESEDALLVVITAESPTADTYGRRDSCLIFGNRRSNPPALEAFELADFIRGFFDSSPNGVK